MSQILPYAILSPAYVEYDPATPEVAQHVVALIEAAAPWARAEHIGSTAIPGCAGKGIVDLVTLYPRGRLEDTRRAVDGLGFQPGRHGLDDRVDHHPARVGDHASQAPAALGASLRLRRALRRIATELSAGTGTVTS